MRKISAAIALSFIVILLSASCDSNSFNWVKYKDDREGNVYLYDTEKIKEVAGSNRVQVWGKQIYSDQGREKELRSRAGDGLSVEGYEKLSHKHVLYEIDCGKHNISVLAIDHYDRDGRVLYSGKSDERKWFSIGPDSTGEILLKKVCSGKE